MYKIGFCGAHGTGKTTLVRLVAQEFGVDLVDRIVRDMWESFGVADFEKLPKDIRAKFQKYAILNQIKKEDGASEAGFVADRTVLDNFVHVVMDTDLSGSDFSLYEALVRERLKVYTHFIYLPVEFEAQNEYLRADITKREAFAEIAEGYIRNWFMDGQYLVATGSIEARMEKIREFLKPKSQS